MTIELTSALPRFAVPGTPWAFPRTPLTSSTTKAWEWPSSVVLKYPPAAQLPAEAQERGDGGCSAGSDLRRACYLCGRSRRRGHDCGAKGIAVRGRDPRSPAEIAGSVAQCCPIMAEVAPVDANLNLSSCRRCTASATASPGRALPPSEPSVSARGCAALL